MADKTKTYEGMFLLDAGQPSIEVASEPIQQVLERSGAETLVLKPWDERRLAYEIAGRKRGLYILTYFKLDPSKVSELEHDCRLEDRILRVMFIRRDNLTEEQMNAETPATGGHRADDERREVDDRPPRRGGRDDRPRRRRDEDSRPADAGKPASDAKSDDAPKSDDNADAAAKDAPSKDAADTSDQ